MKIQKKEQSFRDLWDMTMCSNICIRVPEGKETHKRAKGICEELMAKNFPNLMKSINLCTLKAQKILSSISKKGSTHRYTIVKRLKA